MIAVIGAGVSGLSCAWWLRQQGMAVQVFEADDRVGGKVRSVQGERVLAEAGPHTLYVNAATCNWLRQLGLQPFSPAPASHLRHVLWQGRYHALPTGLFSLLGSHYLSRAAKWRLLSEPWRRSPPAAATESVADFVRRRLGEEWLDKLLAPLMGGVFAGDAEALLMQEALPWLAQLESQAGSIGKGMLWQLCRGRLKRKQAVSLQGGLAQLPLRLASALDVHLSCPVLRLERRQRQWLLHTPHGSCMAQQVVLALPAAAAASLLLDVDATAARALQQVVYAPMSVVSTLVDRAKLWRPLPGFGALHAPGEQAFAAGHLMSSNIYPQRVASSLCHITSFVGGQLYRQQAMLADEALLAGLKQELAHKLGLQGQPLEQQIFRWPQALPQATAAIAPARTAMQGLAGQGVHVCAAWLDGAALSACLDKGRQLACALAEHASAQRSCPVD